MTTTFTRRTSAPISTFLGRRVLQRRRYRASKGCASAAAWLLGAVGVYDVGSLVHVSLLVGLILLLLAILNARDAAGSDRADSGAGRK